MMVTGHRKLVPAGWMGNSWPEANNPVIVNHHVLVYQKIYDYIRQYALQQVSVGNVPTFITGMALGADQVFATAAINLECEGIKSKVIAAIPFAGQEGKWPQPSRNMYNTILNRCAEVHFVCDPGYAAWKMQKRNCWMVDRASRVLAIWNGANKGGTWNCLTYAVSRGKEIDQLNPEYPENPVKKIRTQ
jgi:uncharacterized phage-like protein YoqJ